mmetsp:Transcript_41334/g.119637  ORF Transcript_41334/g.119637 Transcript_41334/m.119637 type:complete len:448 (+) Transcript_41334:421-1764(+)
MEELAHSMTAVRGHDGAIALCCLCVYGSTQITVKRAWADLLRGSVQCAVGGPHQPVCVLIAFSHEVCLVQVRMEALMVDTDIQIHNVAFLNRSTVGYPMADNLIGRDAHRLREAEVIERTWVNLPVKACLPDHPVDLVARDARTHESGGDVQDLAAQAAGLPHGLQLRTLDDGHLPGALAFGEGDAVGLPRVVGRTPALGHPHLRRDVGRAQGARVLVAPEGLGWPQELLLAHLLSAIGSRLQSFPGPLSKLLIGNLRPTRSLSLGTTRPSLLLWPPLFLLGYCCRILALLCTILFSGVTFTLICSLFTSAVCDLLPRPAFVGSVVGRLLRLPLGPPPSLLLGPPLLLLRRRSCGPRAVRVVLLGVLGLLRGLCLPGRRWVRRALLGGPLLGGAGALRGARALLLGLALLLRHGGALGTLLRGAIFVAPRSRCYGLGLGHGGRLLMG